MIDIETISSISLAHGASVDLAARGDGVGGYLWQADIVAGEGVIERLPRDHPPAASIGGGREACFRLVWTGPANGAIRFVLRRPWSNDVAAEHVIAVERADGPAAV